MRQFLKDTLVIEEGVFVRIDCYRCILPGISVMDEEPVIPVILFDDMDIAQVTAALAALKTLERQEYVPPATPQFSRFSQTTRTISRAIRMMMIHSSEFECWMRTSSESIE